MCLIRDTEFERERAQQALPPKVATPIRQRRLAGVLAAVVAAVAAAAVLMFPASTPAVSTSPSPSAPGMSNVRSAAPLVPAVEQASSGLDDGVPTVAARGHCNHEL
jgi:hypothetical protein